MSCCENDIVDLGCIYSCDLVQIGINAPATGAYTIVLMPDMIQIVSQTITAGQPIVFTGGYLNEDGRSIFKVKKPDGTYLTSGESDCFQVDIRPTTNAALADTIIDPVICDDATAVLKNSSGTTISTTDIPSGDTQDITAPDASAVLKNSVNTTLSTTAIPSNTSSNISAPDATAVLKNSLGTTITTNPIPSNVSEDMLAPDATVSLRDSANNIIGSASIPSNISSNVVAPDGTINLVNTDNDQIQTETVRSNQTKSATIPDVDWTDSDSTPQSTPYGDAIVCTPVTPLTLPTPIYAHWDASGLVDNTTNAYGIVSGGRISQLTDKTGNGRHMTQATGANQPALTAAAINGLEAATFDGSRFLNNATFADWAFLHNGSWTIAFVAKMSSSGSAFKNFFGNNANGLAARGIYMAHDNTSSVSALVTSISNGAAQINATPAFNTQGFSFLSWTRDVYQIAILRADLSGSIATSNLIINAITSQTTFNYSKTANTSATNPINPLQLGSNGVGTNSLIGDLVEVVIWNSKQNLTNTGHILNFLNDKYAL